MHYYVLVFYLFLTLSEINYIDAQRLPLIVSNAVPINTVNVEPAKQTDFAAISKASLGYPQLVQLPTNNGLQGVPLHVFQEAPFIVPTMPVRTSLVFGLLPVATFEKDSNALRRKRRSIYNYAVIGPNGHPIETPEVQLAKQTHFAAHLNAGNPHYIPSHFGTLTSVMDTPEVQAAKAHHLAAHYEAITRTSGYNPVHHNLFNLPVTYSNGAFSDTPEVHAAKVQHFAAHAAARARHYQ